MIVDHIKNAEAYYNLSPRIEVALKYLEAMDLTTLEVGKYEIDGDNLFVLIQEYEPKTIEEGKCEAHKKYIDIQYIIKGRECMGYMLTEKGEVTESYDDTKDRLFVKWTGDLVSYTEGMFAIFYPQDAHMPGIKTDGCDFVKKAVVKIAV